MTDPQGRRTVADFAKDLPERVFPVGRLDYNTEGLLLLLMMAIWPKNSLIQNMK